MEKSDADEGVKSKTGFVDEGWGRRGKILSWNGESVKSCGRKERIAHFILIFFIYGRDCLAVGKFFHLKVFFSFEVHRWLREGKKAVFSYLFCLTFKEWRVD